MDDELEPIEIEDAEEVDALPVIAEVRTIERTAPQVIPAVQAAAVAATSFVAGAATLALARRFGARKLAQAQRQSMPYPAPRSPFGDRYPVTGTRTYLVHVHVIGRPDA
jgi:hypothetical protein